MKSKRKKNRIHKCTCETCQRHPYSAIAEQHPAINRVLVTLDEKSRRRCVGLFVLERGRGGIAELHKITGMSRTTSRRGCAEAGHRDWVTGVRRTGGGRKAVEKKALRF
jgi:hypothetical protein